MTATEANRFHHRTQNSQSTNHQPPSRTRTRILTLQEKMQDAVLSSRPTRHRRFPEIEVTKRGSALYQTALASGWHVLYCTYLAWTSRLRLRHSAPPPSRTLR